MLPGTSGTPARCRAHRSQSGDARHGRRPSPHPRPGRRQPRRLRGRQSELQRPPRPGHSVANHAALELMCNRTWGCSTPSTTRSGSIARAYRSQRRSMCRSISDSSAVAEQQRRSFKIRVHSHLGARNNAFMLVMPVRHFARCRRVRRRGLAANARREQSRVAVVRFRR